MAKYRFLTDDWIEEARRIREESASDGTTPSVPHVMRMNLVVTEVPFSPGTVDAHIDTTSGVAELDSGHIDPADLKVTVDYDTALSILVDGNSQVAMQAFMTGKIRVEGDVGKLIELQSAPPGPGAQMLAQRLRDITE
jgi:putative sterol carrier protein